MFSHADVAGCGQRAGKCDRQIPVLRRIIRQRFIGQSRCARQLQRIRRFHDDSVRGGVVRIAVQNLLGDGHGLGGIFVQCHFGPGDLRRRTGAAQHPFEESAASAGFFKLRFAQGLAALKKTRLLFQYLAEQRNGVVQVFPLRSLNGLVKENPRVTRDFVDGFICHVICYVGVKSRFPRQKSTPNAFGVNHTAPCSAARGPQEQARSSPRSSAPRAAARTGRVAPAPSVSCCETPRPPCPARA